MLAKLFPILMAGAVATSAMANSHHPQQFLKGIRGQKDEGALIVAHFCANCHAIKPMISIGAPRVGIDADWQTRVTQGLQMMFKHTDEGFNAMPPRGGCFECNDEQLILAIKAMLSPEMLKNLASASS